MSDETKQGNGGEAKAQPSGPEGGNPGTAGKKSNEDKINPSAPGETGTTTKSGEKEEPGNRK